MTLLLLHGPLASRTQLDALASLVSRRRSIHELQLDDRRDASPGGSTLALGAFVESAVAALDARDLDRVDVFGYEIGGSAALALALAHPHRVSTITTLGTSFAGGRTALGSADMARIHHRVRIMVGDRDSTVSVEESAAAFRQLPSGELMVLPRTPHPLEQVDVYRLADILIELTS